MYVETGAGQTKLILTSVKSDTDIFNQNDGNQMGLRTPAFIYALRYIEIQDK
jgi:hypothetical protein